MSTLNIVMATCTITIWIVTIILISMSIITLIQTITTITTKTITSKPHPHNVTTPLQQIQIQTQTQRLTLSWFHKSSSIHMGLSSNWGQSRMRYFVNNKSHRRGSILRRGWLGVGMVMGIIIMWMWMLIWMQIITTTTTTMWWATIVWTHKPVTTPITIISQAIITACTHKMVVSPITTTTRTLNTSLTTLQILIMPWSISTLASSVVASITSLGVLVIITIRAQTLNTNNNPSLPIPLHSQDRHDTNSTG